MAFVRKFGLALALVLALPVGAGADISTAPTDKSNLVFDQQLSSLLGQDRAALNAVSPSTIRDLYSNRTGRRSKSALSEVVYTRDWIDSQDVVEGDNDWQCLTQALYFEARGESVKGQFAVAEVILNRVDSAKFPGTICKVVNQGTGKRYKCQFSYTCDGRREIVNDKTSWKRAGKIARIMQQGGERVLTSGATYYHTKAVNPRWARKFTRTTSIGVHLFYRAPA
ncbi:cell wall hydrolase [Candidatus Halocynthiibacter alkanivorans]|uniref:cell wall hydrolase n=1 Tax=Candidatus Halocynthiibacter alkanivorans TaxID=2267619 RepID=UPI000DF13645|nr:cell wall hydrolase [Candidatus Halocynthiibacter alkanivorans]